MNSGITTCFEMANKVKPYRLVVIYKYMCEHVKELADESIRMRTEFPGVVGDHLESCEECSQYIAMCSLVSIAGRPPIQMPPVELSTRIANSTFAKQAIWSGLFRKPAVWAPALGVMAAAGWLVASPRDVKQSVHVGSVASSGDTVNIVNVPTPARQIATAKTPENLRPSAVTGSATPKVKPIVAFTYVRENVKRVNDANIRDVVSIDAPVTIPQNTRSAISGVSGVDIAAANPVGTRVTEITADTDHVADVQVPKSARNSTGRASFVLASVDEEAERDDLRASFQSQLNQQSESFRTAMSNAPQHAVDSNRINVVNAPVVTGGK